MIFNFLNKISQNRTKSGKKTRDFLQKLEQKTNKSIEMDGISEESFSRNNPVWERVRARINLQQLSRVWLIFFHFFIDFLNIFRSIYRKFSTFEARLARILTFFEEKNQEFFDRAEK